MVTTMNDLVSICIPTRNRPEFLQECLDSCKAQDYDNIEVLVGDDSDDRFARSVEHFNATRYFKHRNPVGQSANVDYLFALAHGDRIVLMHDDDLLLPNCISKLVSAWQDDTVIAYGKQEYIAHDGSYLIDSTTNDDYYRSYKYAGSRPILEAALLSQIPNNGFMVNANAARFVRYAWPGISVACDTDFSLRLGATFDDSRRALFKDTYTTVSRSSEFSVSRDSRSRNDLMPREKAVLYERVQKLTVPPSTEYARKIFLDRMAPGAIHGFAKQGRKGKALSTYLSHEISLRSRATLLAKALMA